ncbi:MAG: hypothetical protein Q9225_000344 [Loekoesia sp. 1 TL-2023]
MSYSSRRVPKRALITSLCYPLIELDDRNNPLSPTLGVFHKSVADFLKQDPELLGVPESCHKFFVNSEFANLDIVKKCIIYLYQGVYAKPCDTDMTVCKSCDKDDFLLVEEGSVQNDSITVVSQRSVIVPKYEDSESVTNDSSDEEEDIPSVWPTQTCTKNMLLVFVGNETKLFTNSTPSGRLQRSEPKIHPNGQWVIWALDEREVLLWNLESGVQVIQNLSSKKQNWQNDVRFLIDFHFSESSSVLYKCTIISRTVLEREDYLVSDIEFSAYEFRANNHDPHILLKHIDPFAQTIPLKGAWTTQINGPMVNKNRMNLLTAPFKFCWTKADLYVAFGATAIKLARISLALEGPINDTVLFDSKQGGIKRKIQISLLSHQIFLPSSAPKRGWAFAIHLHQPLGQNLPSSSPPITTSHPSDSSTEESLTVFITLNPTSADDVLSTTLSSTILRKDISSASSLGPWISPSAFLANKSLHPSIAEGTWLIWQPGHQKKSQQWSTENEAVGAGAETQSDNGAVNGSGCGAHDGDDVVQGEGQGGKDDTGDWVSLEDTSLMSDVLKGKYAAKDRAFVIPIRSGVEWRRKSFVACW